MPLNALHYANSLSASDRAALAQLIQFSEQIAALRTRQRHLQTGDVSKAAVLEALGLAADIAALLQQQAMLAARVQLSSRVCFACLLTSSQSRIRIMALFTLRMIG